MKNYYSTKGLDYDKSKGKMRRNTSTKAMLARMFGDKKHKPCAYCGKILTLENASFDHVKPISKGGYDRIGNGAVSCKDCNSRKGSKTAGEFLQELRATA